MDNVKDDAYYPKKRVNDLKFIIDHTHNITVDEIKKNEVLLDSVMFRLIQISENSERLAYDFKMRNSEVPWRAIKGMRNRIVHEYGDVDLTVIFDAVVSDVPQLYKLLAGMF